MNPEKFKELQDVFFKVTNLAESDRTSFMAQLAKDDPSLEAQLSSLLAASSYADALFEEPLLSSNLNPLRHLQDFLPGADPQPMPEKIGSYEIERVLGEGGMGIVYHAQCRQPLFREVALKVVKSCVAEDAFFLDRLKWESQALALMNHDHIARIFEVSMTEEGLPYFTMEYIDGAPITHFCDEKRMGFRERIRLFLQICDAVLHAHTRGVIHGDLKPSNILITQGNRGPAAKVIDFGVSRNYKTFATGYAEMPDKLLFGSPSYMSPEQACEGGDVDARSDIYALGAVLYELATGSKILSTHELKGLLPTEKLSRIRENQPTRPLTLLQSLAEEPSQNRGLRKRPDLETCHDLDYVVMKALEQNPDQRYATVKELIDDLNRYLNHEPVNPGVGTRFRYRKWVRRNRVKAFGVAALSMIALIGIIGFSVVFYNTRQAKEEVETALAKMTRTQDFYHHILKMPHPFHNAHDIKFTEVLQIWERMLEQDAAGDPELESQVRLTLGETWMSLGFFDEALQQLQAAVSLRVTILGPEHQETLLARDLAARGLTGAERLDEAAALFEEIMEIQARTLGILHPDRMWAQTGLATVYLKRGDIQNAALLCTESTNRLMMEDHDPRARDAAEMLANIQAAAGNTGQAVTLLRQILADQIGGAVSQARTLVTMQNLANVLLVRQELEEAESLYRRVLERRTVLLGENHPHTLGSKHGLAQVLRRRGLYEEAWEMAVNVWETQKADLGETNPNTLVTRRTLALLAAKLKGPERAVSIFQELRDTYRQLNLVDGEEYLKVLNNLGHYLMEAERGEEALQVLDQALSLKAVRFGDAHPSTLNTMVTMGEALQSVGRLEEASAHYRNAISALKARHPDDRKRLALYQACYGSCLTEMGRFQEAESLLSGGLKEVEPGSSTYRMIQNHLSQLNKAREGAEKAGQYHDH